MKNKLTFLLLIGFSSLLIAQNDTDILDDNDSKWQYDVTPYMWFSSLKGNVSFLNQSVPVDAEFKDIFDQLSFGALLHTEAHKGPWTIMTDIVYLKLKESGTLRSTSQMLSSETEQFIIEFGGAHRLIKLEDYFALEGVFGLRYFGLNPSIDINQSTVFDKNLDFVDPYVGMRFKSINGKWINRAGFDVGGFGIGSELSWKLNLFIGYQISKPLSLYLGYQGYDVNYDDSDTSFNYDVLTGGFILGISVSF